MKIAAYLKPVGNTQHRLLRALKHPRTVAEIVAVFYPNSKQPHKKTVTVTQHLRRLKRLGRVQESGKVWFIPGSDSPGSGRRMVA